MSEFGIVITSFMVMSTVLLICIAKLATKLATAEELRQENKFVTKEEFEDYSKAAADDFEALEEAIDKLETDVLYGPATPKR